MALSNIIASPNGVLCLPSWPTGRSTWVPFGACTPVLAPLARSSTPSWTPCHPAITKRPSIRSASLSLATPMVEVPLPLPPKALRAPRALAFVSHHLSGRLRVRLKLHHLLHLLAIRDSSEVSRISQDSHSRVHGRRDPDSGEPRRCSIPASILLAKSC